MQPDDLREIVAGNPRIRRKRRSVAGRLAVWVVLAVAVTAIAVVLSIGRWERFNRRGYLDPRRLVLLDGGGDCGGVLVAVQPRAAGPASLAEDP